MAGDTGVALRQTNRRVSRPYWARLSGCQVATDGASAFLLRYDERTGQRDSLALPAWRIPRWGRARGDGARMRIGGAPVVERPRPASLARWSDLVVDPDGWAWVRAWTEDPNELRVFAVSLQSGRIVEVATPAFPRTFGEAGVFYAVTRNRSTDEISASSIPREGALSLGVRPLRLVNLAVNLAILGVLGFLVVDPDGLRSQIPQRA